MIAARWLGGRASEGLTGDAVLLDLLAQGDSGSQPAFLVRRLPQVSHHAMMAQQDQSGPNLETAAGPAGGTDPDA
jgi:hypothetical protein